VFHSPDASSFAYVTGCNVLTTFASAYKSDSWSHVQHRHNLLTLLVISKFDYEELVHNYPEQNDIIVTNVLSLFGLDKDGNDSSVSKDSADTISDDAKEKLR
jgi:hypothetical protein